MPAEESSSSIGVTPYNRLLSSLGALPVPPPASSHSQCEESGSDDEEEAEEIEEEEPADSSRSDQPKGADSRGISTEPEESASDSPSHSIFESSEDEGVYAEVFQSSHPLTTTLKEAPDEKCLEKSRLPGSSSSLGVSDQKLMRISKSFDGPLLKSSDEALESTGIRPPQESLAAFLGSLSDYRDVYYSQLSRNDAIPHDVLRSIAARHVLMHALRSRRRVSANTRKLRSGSKVKECRDQGFTRPTVLVLLPLRSSAFEFVSQLTELVLASEVRNRDKLEERYGSSDDDEEEVKKYPHDWNEVFRGNVDDCFVMGISLVLFRRRLHLFSGLHACDIVVASPLGLMVAAQKETLDYLSSIEICLLDECDVMEMQNWEHVRTVLRDAVNALPKSSSRTDFSRVREANLDGHARLLRQTVMICGRFCEKAHADMMNSTLCANSRGVVRFKSHVDRPSCALQGSVRLVHQVFRRFGPCTLTDMDDVRFDAFRAEVLPRLLATEERGILVVMRSYLELVKLREFFDASQVDFSFSVLSEFGDRSDTTGARSDFFHGTSKVLLMTERFFYYHRLHIRGARAVLWYSLPDNADFYREILELLSPEVIATGGGCVSLFCRFDMYRLERIFGTENTKKLISHPLPVLTMDDLR